MPGADYRPLSRGSQRDFGAISQITQPWTAGGWGGVGEEWNMELLPKPPSPSPWTKGHHQHQHRVTSTALDQLTSVLHSGDRAMFAPPALGH
jgi:hypothetical protein